MQGPYESIFVLMKGCNNKDIFSYRNNKVPLLMISPKTVHVFQNSFDLETCVLKKTIWVEWLG